MEDVMLGLSTFLEVAERKSFRAAAEALGVTGSAVSQTVRKLEERLGMRLLHRTTRSVSLTEAGERLRGGLVPAFADVRAAVAGLDALKRKPSGTLRLSVSSIAEAFLSDGVITEFLREYPEVNLDVAIDDGDGDVVAEGFDAGVRLGEVVAKDMVAVPVSRTERQIVVASPAYFAKHGKPKRPRDLLRHTCIGWRDFRKPHPYRWELTEDGKDIAIDVRSRVNTTDMALMVRLAIDGVGITCGLESTFRDARKRGLLETALEGYCPPFPGFFLYYPSRSNPPPKLLALVALLRKRAKKKA